MTRRNLSAARSIASADPFLTGVGLWALVHLIGNGDVASLVFFAVWAVVALAGTVSIDKKRQRLFGAAWEPFAAQTSIVPSQQLPLGEAGSGRAKSVHGAGPPPLSSMC
jgi:uncharacterized membrane protein